MKIKGILLSFVVVGTLGVAASSFAESRPSFSADQRTLSQALSELRSTKSKLGRIERDFDGHKSRAEQSVAQSISEVESAIEYARNNPELPPKHHHPQDR